MNYNFDQINDRRNSGSLKWDVADNELPMWVADMDFQTAPEVTHTKSANGSVWLFDHTGSMVYGVSVLVEETS